jgi:hypothetical protein
MKRDDPKMPNKGVVYSYVETTKGLPKAEEFPNQLRYVGSSNDYVRRMADHNNENYVNVDKVDFKFIAILIS